MDRWGAGEGKYSKILTMVELTWGYMSVDCIILSIFVYVFLFLHMKEQGGQKKLSGR